MEENKLLDLTNSKLTLHGTPEDRGNYARKIKDLIHDLESDRNERKQINTKRRDFYSGNQGQYSNVVGVIQDTKNKKGHTNQVTNYAGKTAVKIAYTLANNPPKITIPSLDVNDETENIRAQAVQDHIDSVLNSRKNRFWKKTYRRAVFNQVVVADAAFRIFPLNGEIRIINHDNMDNIMVAWNGYDPDEYDCVIAESYVTVKYIEETYGIKVDTNLLEKVQKKAESGASGGWNNNEYNTKGSGQPGTSSLPSGNNDLPKLKLIDYDSEEAYVILIEGEIVQLILKDDINFPRISFWVFVKNIPNPPSPWSISDIDYLIDPQIELNDNDNRTSDYIAVGGVQRYVAYNMSDFDPASIKKSSGQVIFVTDPNGTSRFEPLQTNINNFPSDQYNQRKMSQIYDMGLPKVNYGASGADSGRSKAIDYQSSIDLTIFKRDAWELALQSLIEKIQIFGHMIHKDQNWWNDSEGNFVVRNADFDWTDILPVSASDKIVNVANKYNMIGLPLEEAFKELGYRNPTAMVEKLKKELSDPNLMILRSKQWDLSKGLLMANNEAATMAQSNLSETPPPATNENEQFPTLTSSQNEGAKPMMQKGGTTAFSSAKGMIDRMQQNRMAQGG